MADEQTQTDQTGVERTTTGTIVDQSTGTDQSSTTTTQEKTPPAKSEDGKTLLTEGKKEESAKDGAKDPPKKDAAAGAPEKYADYTVPEGWTLDAEVKGKADGLFKELNLSQEQAQKAVDFYRELTTEAFNAPFKAYQDMTTAWRTESESHPDLRGKIGPGQEVNVRIAKFLDGINDAKLVSDFKEHMDLTGAGNYQAFIRVLDYAAKRSTEGTHVAGNGPGKDGQSAPNRPAPSAAGALWPNLPSARG